MTTQQGDVNLFQTVDDGDISVVDGLVETSGGLGVAAYLSLFGGNEDDDGRQANQASWWGNVSESQPERQYRSETQNLLRALPATAFNLKRIEDAAVRDLQWFLDSKVASSVSVQASMPGVNRVRITVDIEAVGVVENFEFTENWSAET